jgi:aspartate/methionine/tyrosine aminotransferase
MQRLGLGDYDRFRRRLLRETGVSVCARTHFGRPLAGEADFHIRLAYSGIGLSDIREGLEKFRAFAEG